MSFRFLIVAVTGICVPSEKLNVNIGVSCVFSGILGLNNIKWKSPGDSLIVDFDGISNMLCLSILAMSFFMMLRWISIEENNGHETEFKVISLLELFFNTTYATKTVAVGGASFIHKS